MLIYSPSITSSLSLHGNGHITGSLFVTGAISASLGPNTIGFFGTSSWALSASNVVSASFATTASYALNASSTPAFPFTGNAIISGSLLVSGSGLTISGSVNAPNITGSLFGTASWSNNSTLAATASSVLVFNDSILATNLALYFGETGSVLGIRRTVNTNTALRYNTNTNTITATSSWANNVRTASYVTSSNVIGPAGSNSILSASYALTASYALNAGNPTFTINGANFNANGESLLLTGSNGLSASIIDNTTSLTASFGFPVDAQITLGGVTASLFGTASRAESAVIASRLLYANAQYGGSTVSFLSPGNAPATNQIMDVGIVGGGLVFNVTTKTITATSSWTNNVTSSNVLGPHGPNSILTASYALSAGAAGNPAFTISNAVTNASFNANGESLLLTGSNGLAVTLTDNTTSVTASFGFATNARVTLGSITGSLLGTASFATRASTASYVNGMVIKSGIISGPGFGGNPKTSSITFNTAFPNSSYTITVTGVSDARTWTIDTPINASGFTINSNSNVALVGSIYWQAISSGEFTS